ncbi:hypothetical protein ACHAXA_008552 [Cyclostephanos tholiformis]|uniref:Uncharacterized protein n=1 Tax=Cyclostephanos tholiformis TaxID=382380 RepID=A0ABD3RA79_9STRA
MIEELQRSVQYYSRANSSIKSQNTELERQLLLAKHQVLMNRSSNGQLEGHGDDIAPAADVSIRKDAAPIPAPKAPPQQVHSSESMSIIGHRGSLCVPSSTPAHVSKVAIDDQAQQAQFAATQALYTSMGYPAGAARFAASTLSQFVGQTGIPLVTSAPDDYVVSSERNPAPKAAQQIKPIQSISSENALKSPNVEPKEDSYIDALNRFAMQQAAAANAAAAAATAALQAAQLHLQYKEGGGSSSVSDAPKFPFSFPAGGMAWPFPSPAQFPKND